MNDPRRAKGCQKAAIAGIILFTPTSRSPLFRIPASGGAAVAVTKLEKQNSHRFPQFLPGGRQFLFYATGTPDTQGIYLGSLDSKDRTRLFAADSKAIYAAPGYVLFNRANTVFAQPFDAKKLVMVGEPIRVAEGALLPSASVQGSASRSRNNDPTLGTFAAWGRRPDAALWYAVCWAEGKRPERDLSAAT